MSLGSAAAAVALFAVPALAATWVNAPAPAVGTQSALNSVDLLSATDGWAVGGGGAGSTGGVVERWNGQQFSVVTSPNLLAGQDSSAFAGLSGVDAVSATKAFAVGTLSFFSGGLSHSNAVAETWNGTAWSRMTVPNAPSTYSFRAVKAFSATDAWAVGRNGDTFFAGTLAMHWDGSTWTPVATPSPGTRENVLTSVSGSGPNDVWAVGYYRDLPYGNRDRHPLALHWNGTAWSQVAAPDLGARVTVLQDVTALSPTNAWAVGYTSGATVSAVAEHWDGSAWTAETVPALGTFAAITAVSATDLWAVGTDATNSSLPVLANRNASGWTTSSVPLTGPVPSGTAVAALLDLNATSTGAAVAVGYTTADVTTGVSSPLAIRTANG
jgi:hypothetical protein